MYSQFNTSSTPSPGLWVFDWTEMSLKFSKAIEEKKKMEPPRIERRDVSEEVRFACVPGHIDGGGQNEWPGVMEIDGGDGLMEGEATHTHAHTRWQWNMSGVSAEMWDRQRL